MRLLHKYVLSLLFLLISISFIMTIKQFYKDEIDVISVLILSCLGAVCAVLIWVFIPKVFLCGDAAFSTLTDDKKLEIEDSFRRTLGSFLVFLAGLLAIVPAAWKYLDTLEQEKLSAIERFGIEKLASGDQINKGIGAEYLAEAGRQSDTQWLPIVRSMELIARQNLSLMPLNRIVCEQASEDQKADGNCRTLNDKVPGLDHNAAGHASVYGLARLNKFDTNERSQRHRSLLKYRRIDLSSLNLNSINFSGPLYDLTGVDLKYSDFVAAKFNNTIARCANFGRTVITGTTFNDAKLQGADFNGAFAKDHKFVHPDNNQNGPSFKNADLDYVDFRGVDLSDASGLEPEQLRTACGDGSEKFGLDLEDIKLRSCENDDYKKERQSALKQFCPALF